MPRERKKQARSGSSVAGKGVKKWAKHGSCVSNPEHTSFREAAQNRLKFKPSGPSALTLTAVQKHDGGSGESMEVTAGAFDAQTFKTWATGFTDCTNLTFGAVHKLWNSNNTLHKEILGLLATLTELIKEKGGSGTDTEYFASLLTYMVSADTLESATAGAVLMSMCVRKIPTAMLQHKFSVISKQLTDSIEQYEEKMPTSLMKALLMTLAVVLKAQEAAVWNVSSTVGTFNVLLHFTTTTKPRVRKAARQAVKMILTSLPDSSTCHPAAVPTAQYCVEAVKKSGKMGVHDMVSLHVMNLLQDVMINFPQKEIKMCCETVLQLMFINKPVIKTNGMSVLHSLFRHQPSEKLVTADLNSQIINALYDHQPTENDNGVMPTWLAVMEQAHLNLSRLKAPQAVDHLPRLLSVAMKCLQSHHKDVRTAAAQLINVMVRECLSEDKLQGVGSDSGSLCRVVEILEGGLSFQFINNMDLVLQLHATLMEVLGKVYPELLQKCLESLAALRDTAHFSFKTEVDVAVGKAVRAMGPKHVLEAVPLRITGTEDNPDLSRSWLLPVLRDNVSNTELSFFTTYFVPLAERFVQKGKDLAAQGLQAVSKTYQALELQVWSLLKGFCTRPTDLAKSFKGIAKQLGSTLTDRLDLQMDVLASLRMLINFSKENEGDRVAVSQFAKNFLPLLFNLYTADPDNPRDSRRLAVLETIKVYLTVTDSKLHFSFLDMCTSKMAAADITAFRKIALMDLALTMVKYADASRLATLYSLAEQNIDAQDKTLQKKAYRILEEMCVCETETGQQFLTSNLTQIQQLLLGSLSSSAPNSKNPRLRCLRCICQRLAEPNHSFIQAVVPEAILCTRGVGERARVAAFQLILAVAGAMVRWNPQVEQEEMLSQYVNLLLAGLSGSPDMVCGTLLALRSVLQHFKGQMSGRTLSSVMAIVCQLLSSVRREVVKNTLDFVKLFIGAYSRDVLCTHLTDMVNGLSAMKEKMRRPCHIKIKQILKKLIKKFEYEAVQKLCSKPLQAVAQKAHKELKQEEKKRKEQQGHDDNDDDDDDDDVTVKQKPETLEEILQFSDMEEDEEEDKGQKTQQRSAFIVEDEGDVVDILDKSAAKKVMTSKPKSSSVAATRETEEPHGGFKIAPDGRLIITDAEEKKQGEKVDEDEEDLDDLLTMIEGGSDKKRRKRLREEAEHEDEPQKKYKPGGHGIHRPLSKTQTPDYGAEYRSKKGAGDVKRPGKLDPYSYVPLQRKFMNKRKQAKAKGQFEALMKGAKKGAVKGMNINTKSRKARRAALKHGLLAK